MKKFLVFFLVLTLTVWFATAEEMERDEIGLTISLEFGIDEVNTSDKYPYSWLSVRYETELLDGALDIGAEIAHDMGFVDGLPQGLYFDLMAGINIDVGESSTLSIILENENYVDLDADGDKVAGVFKPGLMFNQSFDGGDIYFKLDSPIAYLFYGIDPFFGLDITAGWESAFGLGIEVSGHILFNNLYDDEKGFTGVGFTTFFDAEPIYAEVAVTIPIKDLSDGSPYYYFDVAAMDIGICITPLFSFAISPLFQIYASCQFGGIGVDGGDISITPAIGIILSF